MLKKSLLFIFVISFIAVTGQEIDLVSNWKFFKGDDKMFSDTRYNDKEWHIIQAGKPFEQQGFDGFDGIVWYRKTIVLPSTLKEKSSDGLVFILGKIDDADQFYLNGKLYGSTGSSEKKDELSYSIIRKYTVPYADILWNNENVISVRVIDYTGNGGLYSGPYEIRQSKWFDFVSFKLSFNGAEAPVFNSGEVVSGKVLAINNGKKALEGRIIYTLTTDKQEVISVQEESIIMPLNREIESSFKYTPVRAGFYIIKCMIIHSGDTLFYEQKFAYDASNVFSPPIYPDDFNSYWELAKAELAKVAPRYTMIKSLEYSTSEVDVYEVEMYSLGEVRVGGWLSLPKASGKYPVLIRMIGYSGDNMPVVDRPEFAVLSFNIRGHGNSKKDVNPGFPGFFSTDINDKYKYIYRGAYMDCVRAIDFICTRPEVDTSRIAVYGGSQGGALSFAAAALDSRIKLCAPHIPFLSDFRNYFAITDFPRQIVEEYLLNKPEVTWETVYNTLDYIDIKNLAPRISCPVLMGVGLQDMTCPPQINFAAFNNLSSKDKEYKIFPNSAHSVPQEQHDYELQWIKKHFGMISK